MFHVSFKKSPHSIFFYAEHPIPSLNRWFFNPLQLKISPIPAASGSNHTCLSLFNTFDLWCLFKFPFSFKLTFFNDLGSIGNLKKSSACTKGEFLHPEIVAPERKSFHDFHPFKKYFFCESMVLMWSQKNIGACLVCIFFKHLILAGYSFFR